MATVDSYFKVKHGLIAAETIIAPASTTAIPSLRVPHGSAPTSPTNGDIWTTTAGIYVRINGVTVGPLGSGGGAGVTVSDTAPSSPSSGDLWYDSINGKLYIWYDSFWIEAGGPAGGSPGVSGNTILNGASNPTTEGVDGDFYINTTSDVLFGPKAAGTWPGSGVSLAAPSPATTVTTLAGLQSAVVGAATTYAREDHKHAVTGLADALLQPFSRSGALTVLAGSGRFILPFATTILGISASVNTAPMGAAILIDVNKNGTTIFTTQGNRPTIAISAFATAAEVTNMNITSFSAGDYMTVDVDQIGSTVAGSDLTVVVRYKAT